MNSGDELVTAQELADALSLSVDTIWRYTREKRIPYVEIGKRQYRYHKHNVLRALSEEPLSTLAKEDPVIYHDKKKLTYDDYAKLPEEPGFRHEIIDGVLIRDSSPSVHHQRVTRRLQRILENYIEKTDPNGEIFNAPLDLALDAYTVVQPDLLYLPGSRPAQNTPIDVVPELVVEVTSPSTSRKDRVQKLNHYQSVGVAHYWIVDPQDSFIEAYELRDGHYVSIVRSYTGTFSHPRFTGLAFDIEILFSKPN
jgi:excisionase family DNA binding protein